MAALADASAELARGQSLDRYELVYPVARGGMARVWVAKLRGKHGFEKMVALKTILPKPCLPRSLATQTRAMPPRATG